MNQVFIDSSFIFALLVDADSFHADALAFYDVLVKNQAELVVSNYILDETYTLLRIKAGRTKCLELRNAIESSDLLLKVVRVTFEDDAAAWNWFENDWSKLSFTDCTSFAVMKRLGITQVATFDEHFVRAGFQVLGLGGISKV